MTKYRIEKSEWFKDDEESIGLARSYEYYYYNKRLGEWRTLVNWDRRHELREIVMHDLSKIGQVIELPSL